MLAGNLSGPMPVQPGGEAGKPDNSDSSAHGAERQKAHTTAALARAHLGACKYLPYMRTTNPRWTGRMARPLQWPVPDMRETWHSRPPKRPHSPDVPAPRHTSHGLLMPC